jgi:hypothetical protein
LRNEVNDRGVEVVTVCLETLGPEPGRPYVEAAQAEHPCLVDTEHLVDRLFGIINIPNAVWIDEQGMIVRPAEPAWPAPRNGNERGRPLPEGTPQRLLDIMAEARNIVAWTADHYADAIRDWADNGADSGFVMSSNEVVARSGARDSITSAAAAHFALASHFEQAGDHQRAVQHFRTSHRLAPANWTYKRQAWSIEGELDGPMARFWQGPIDGQPWPYESDWLSEIRAKGAEHYYRETHL